MKIFAIKSDSLGERTLGYLLYYEKADRFYIELPDAADEWDTPMLLSSFVKRGRQTVDSYWSRQWVQQRIVPADRQNIGSILRDNGLDRYDEMALLELSEGRCAQDDYYIVSIRKEALPEEVLRRFDFRVEEAVPLEGSQLMVFFRDGTVRRCDMKSLCTDLRFARILQYAVLFSAVAVQTDGFGVTWGENLDVAAEILYREGEVIPLSLNDFRQFASFCVTDTAGACKALECSRQNISDLVKRGKLHPLRSSGAGALFWKSDLRKRMWE